MRLAFLIPPMMFLAACGQGGDKKDATEISIKADGDDGDVRITAGKDGNKVAIKGDGVDLALNLPDFANLDVEGDFDIDGVKLYPGSKVTKVDVDASDKGGRDTATVKLGFTTPAPPAKAADWMASEFARKNIQVERAGTTLRGTDADGEDFTIRFEPDGTTSKGEVLIVKS